MTNLSRQEIDQLKQQLDEKMAEFRAIYHQLIEAGGVELPEDILDKVAGGIIPKIPTLSPGKGSSVPQVALR